MRASLAAWAGGGSRVGYRPSLEGVALRSQICGTPELGPSRCLESLGF